MGKQSSLLAEILCSWWNKFGPWKCRIRCTQHMRQPLWTGERFYTSHRMGQSRSIYGGVIWRRRSWTSFRLCCDVHCFLHRKSCNACIQFGRFGLLMLVLQIMLLGFRTRERNRFRWCCLIRGLRICVFRPRQIFHLVDIAIFVRRKQWIFRRYYFRGRGWRRNEWYDWLLCLWRCCHLKILRFFQ